MMNYLAILTLLGKYQAPIAQLNAMLPTLSNMINEATPHLEWLGQFLQKNDHTIKELEAFIPTIQAFVKELEPLLPQTVVVR